MVDSLLSTWSNYCASIFNLSDWLILSHRDSKTWWGLNGENRHQMKLTLTEWTQMSYEITKPRPNDFKILSQSLPIHSTRYTFRASALQVLGWNDGVYTFPTCFACILYCLYSCVMIQSRDPSALSWGATSCVFQILCIHHVLDKALPGISYV